MLQGNENRIGNPIKEETNITISLYITIKKSLANNST